MDQLIPFYNILRNALTFYVHLTYLTMRYVSLLILSLVGVATAKYLLVDLKEDGGTGKNKIFTTANESPNPHFTKFSLISN